MSGQIRALEDAVGSELFDRQGRRLQLTASGRVVMQYADEIFTLGAELSERMKSGDPGITLTMNIGVVNSIAKLIAANVIEPALDTDTDFRVTVFEGDLDRLLIDLAMSRLDLVLSDRAMPKGATAKAYNHSLGESEIAFFAPVSMAQEYASNFPASLDQAPLLLPSHTSALRRRLDAWFDSNKITPRIVAEFDDSALMKAFAGAGRGLFPAPAVIATPIEDMYSTRVVGTADGLNESYYVISPERKISNPGALRVIEAGKRSLFATS